MSEPIDRFCEVVNGLAEDDAKTVMSVFQLMTGGSSAAVFLPNLDELRDRLQAMVDFGLSERFLIPSVFWYLTDYFRGWVEEESVQDSIDANLGLLEDLRADLLRPSDKRRTSASDPELRDLISKIQGVVPRKQAQREQGRRINAHLEAARATRFDKHYWRQWLSRKAGG
jgi:hypothetical protein